MEKTDKAIKIGKIVFKSIWSAGALFFWIAGLVASWIPNMMDNKLGSWMMWGALCSPFIIVFIIKIAKGQANTSARDGARQYTYNSTTGTISNHPFAGYVFGFVLGLVFGIAAGPIAVPCFILKNLVDIIKLVFELKNAA